MGGPGGKRGAVSLRRDAGRSGCEKGDLRKQNEVLEKGRGQKVGGKASPRPHHPVFAGSRALPASLSSCSQGVPAAG